MRFSSRLLALLISVSAISGCAYWSVPSQQQPVTAKQQVRTPLTVEQIDDIAEKITVLIDGSNPGSGVIIAKKKNWFTNTYYVLTAKHVVQGRSEYDVVTHDGKRYWLDGKDADETVKELPDVDLAVVKFSSKENYRVATLASYNFANRSVYFEGYDKAKIQAFVSGFPDPNQEKDFREQKRLFTIGSVRHQWDAPFGIEDGELSAGYEFKYSSITYRGMSGGAVLDASGRVIAIHGRNSGVTEIQEGRRVILGQSLGVPITTFLRLAPQVGMQLPLSVEGGAPVSLSGKIPNKYFPAVSTESTDYIDWLNWGNEFLRLEQYEEGAIAINLALKYKPDSPLAWYSLSRVSISYQAMLANLDKAIKYNQNKDFYQAWGARCSTLSEMKRYQEAVESCDKGIDITKRLNTESFVLWHWRASALERMGRHEEAITSYEQAIKIRANPHSYLNLGYNREQLGDYQGAIENYTQAIQLNPDYSQAYRKRAFARLIFKNNYKEAVEDFNQIIRINPDDAEAYAGRGTLRSVLGDKQGAIADHTKAISIDPNNVISAQAYANRGQYRADLGDKKAAIEDLHKAAELSIEAGHMQIAKGYLDEITKLDPSNTNAYALRGIVRFQLKDKQGAIEDINQTIQLKPTSYSGYYNRGVLRSDLEDYQGAIEDLSQTILLKPDFARAYTHRAALRFQQKEFDDAQDVIQDLQKAAHLFREQKDEAGQKQLQGVVRHIQNTLTQGLQDENTRQIQQALNEL